jgi:6-phosphogluconolactonase (cycloisomerase 2 family)
MKTTRSSRPFSLKATVLSAALLASIGGPQPCASSASAGQPQAEGSASFVYVIANPDGPNAVLAYSRNTATGELALVGSYATGGLGTGRVVDSQSPLVAAPDGKYLFAVNPGSDDVSVMAVKDDGSLELVGSPTTSRGIEPCSLAIHRDLLYIANKGDSANPPSYVGYFVSPAGELRRIKRRIELNIGANPAHILFNRTGTRLIGTRLGDRTTGGQGVDLFAVKPVGKLRLLAQLAVTTGPFGAVFNPIADDQLLVSDARLPGANLVRLVDNNSLSLIQSISNSPERAACWITVAAAGNLALVANTGTHSISLYSIKPDGALSLESSHNTALFGRAPFELALAQDNQFVYQLNTAAGFQSVHVLKLTNDGAGSQLNDVAAAPIPPGGVPIGLVVLDR